MKTIIVKEPQHVVNVSREGDQGPPGPTFPSITLTIGDGIDPILGNTQGHSAPIPYNCRILAYSIAALDSQPSPQSISIEFYKDNYQTNFPPITKISGDYPVSLVNEVVKKEDIDQEEWDTYINENDCIGFRVAFSDNIARKVQIILYTVRTF